MQYWLTYFPEIIEAVKDFLSDSTIFVFIGLWLFLWVFRLLGSFLNNHV